MGAKRIQQFKLEDFEFQSTVQTLFQDSCPKPYFNPSEIQGSRIGWIFFESGMVEQLLLEFFFSIEQ